MKKSGLIIFFALLFFCEPLFAAAYPYIDISAESGRKGAGCGDAGPAEISVIGFLQRHEVKGGDTLLDIARRYGLGINDLRRVYPRMDPWLPPRGKELTIPTMWVLPAAREAPLVINLAEMRIYRFFERYGMVKTYPLGIGREGFETPVTECRVVERHQNPSWTVPPGARGEYKQAVMPPGPDNPLGRYWLGLSAANIGIHGTNFPWGIGRRVSRGCLRLYPEHIAQLFEETSAGMRVQIIYEPVKIGVRNERIYLEVHPDLYGKKSDFSALVRGLIHKRDLARAVEWEKVWQCVVEKNGVPTLVGQI